MQYSAAGAAENTPVDGDQKKTSDESHGSDVEDSEDSEDEEDEDEHYQVWHDDHWDKVGYRSPWTKWVHVGHGWPHSFMRSDELSKTNEQLLQDPGNRRWLQRLSTLRRSDLPSLKVSTTANWKIPLFKDVASGDEYSLHLHIGTYVSLNKINCRSNWDAIPDHPSRWKRLGDPLYQVRYRRPLTDEASRPSEPALPNYIIALGKLAVRTRAREEWETLMGKDRNPPTEITDYTIVVDAAHEDLPIWLLVSRPILRDRAECEGKDHPQLPVFKGLLKDDSYGYDSACIFRSIRNIAGPTDFGQVCELVRKTRAAVDPGLLNTAEEKMAELSGTTLPEGWSEGWLSEEVPPPSPKEVIDDHLGSDPADLARANSF